MQLKFSVPWIYAIISLISKLFTYGECRNYGYAYNSFSGPVSGDVSEVTIPVYGATDDEHDSPPSRVDYVARPDYAFSYGIEDPDSGVSQARSESRDGDVVRGEYSVVEPDGYLRRVVYTADPQNGFQATVHYIPPSESGTYEYNSEPPSGSEPSSPSSGGPSFPPSESFRNFPSSAEDFSNIPIPDPEEIRQTMEKINDNPPPSSAFPSADDEDDRISPPVSVSRFSVNHDPEEISEPFTATIPNHPNDSADRPKPLVKHYYHHGGDGGNNADDSSEGFKDDEFTPDTDGFPPLPPMPHVEPPEVTEDVDDYEE